MEETLMKLIEYLENVAPVIWNTAVRQAYIIGAWNICGGIVSIAFAIVFGVAFKRKIAVCDTRDHDDLDEVLATLFCVSFLLFAGLSYYFLRRGIFATINPQWEAIQILIQSLRP